MDASDAISESLADVNRQIALACRDAGRDVGSVTLIAVSKTFPADVVEHAIAAGQKVFGENRVQETRKKWPELRLRHPDIELHLVGPLQTNKVREALTLFDVIHTLDRISLAAELRKEIARCGGLRLPRLLVQVNTGAEPQKAGVLPEEADAFIHACRVTYGLEIEGLMCIPPVEEAPAPHFALTAKIAARNGLKLLSMGMSSDFEIAIEFGATHVRVGSAIFGARGKV